MARVKAILALSAAFSVGAGSCHALSPNAASFVRSIGLDPASPDVVAADHDGVISTIFHGDPATFSLESLALEKKANAVRSFVVMRRFIAALKADFDGAVIPRENYDSSYLTAEERTLVGKRAIKDLAAKQ